MLDMSGSKRVEAEFEHPYRSLSLAKPASSRGPWWTTWTTTSQAKSHSPQGRHSIDILAAA